jgi:hypothetical protein
MHRAYSSLVDVAEASIRTADHGSSAKIGKDEVTTGNWASLMHDTQIYTTCETLARRVGGFA